MSGLPRMFVEQTGAAFLTKPFDVAEVRRAVRRRLATAGRGEPTPSAS